MVCTWCRASLFQCEADEDMSALVDTRGADPTSAALLIECRGRTKQDLVDRIDEVNEALLAAGLPFGCKASDPKRLSDYPFREKESEAKTFWDMRKGLIPIVGAAREPGASLSAL